MPSETDLPSLDQVDSIVGDLLGLLQQPEKLDLDKIDKMKDGLFALKRMQNEIFSSLRKTEDTMKERKMVQEKKERQLEALRYEQSQLEAEIAECQNFKMTYLKRLMEDEKCDSMEQFLEADVSDPADKHKIITKLQLEINARGTLQRDVQAKEKALASLQDEVKKKKDFLSTLPNQLAAIERASMPLQKNMFGSDSKTKGLRMNGTDRLARLEAAKSLCLPLYTLFASLQHYIDQAACQDDTPKLSLAVAGSGENQEILLHIPIPDATLQHARPKKVTIHFQYVEQNDVIAAIARCASTSLLFQDVVLEDLFPSQTTSHPDRRLDAENVYSWSNYLGGIHHVEKDVSQSSVRAIVRMLCRRVRANVTLKSVVSALVQRHQIPALPENAMLETTCLDHNCKLTLFSSLVEKDDRGNTDLLYKVVFRKEAEQLVVQVKLHKARYPEIPPLWTLNVPEDGKTPVYNEKLANLERSVNVELLESIKDASEYVQEWILIHQMHRIMEALDGW